MLNKKSILLLLGKYFHVLLRVLSIISKFGLVLFIGKEFKTSDLGEYSLFVTTINLLVYLIGFDFYTFSSRELLRREHEDRYNVIKNQFSFYIISYLIILPIIFLIYFLGVVETNYFIYLLVVLLTEHLGQELYRLYVNLSKHIFANFLLFLRAGAWCYLLIALWLFGFDEFKNLESIFSAWLVFSGLSVVVGFTVLYKEFFYKKGKLEKVDFNWLKKGIRVSSNFLISTFAFKVIEFSDRYVIDLYKGKSDVGVYGFFSNIVNFMHVIVFTLVASVYFPQMIERKARGDYENLEKVKKSFFKENIIYSLFCVIGLLGSIRLVLSYLDKESFFNNLDSFYLLVLAIFFLNLSLLPHYNLYIDKKDNYLRNISILAAIINIVLNFILIRPFGMLGASISTLLSFILLFLFKTKIFKSLFS